MSTFLTFSPEVTDLLILGGVLALISLLSMVWLLSSDERRDDDDEGGLR